MPPKTYTGRGAYIDIWRHNLQNYKVGGEIVLSFSNKTTCSAQGRMWLVLWPLPLVQRSVTQETIRAVIGQSRKQVNCDVRRETRASFIKAVICARFINWRAAYCNIQLKLKPLCERSNETMRYSDVTIRSGMWNNYSTFLYTFFFFYIFLHLSYFLTKF